MKKINEKAVIGRIKGLREEHVGQRGKSKFARALGLSPSTYNYYEENRVPPVDILLRICELTGTDLGWLLTGEGSEKRRIFGPNSELLNKLDALLAENPSLAEPVAAFVELLCEKKGIEGGLEAKAVSSASGKPGWIPVLGRTAAGIVHFWRETRLPEPTQVVTELEELVRKHIGKAVIGSVEGAVLVDLGAQALLTGIKKRRANLIQVGPGEDEEIVEFVECEDIRQLFPDSFALRIDGDSMSPRINDGDIVVLSPSVPAAQGHIAIARLANQIGVTCKLIRTSEEAIHLIPINERYETKVVPKGDLLWALAVLCHISM